MYSVGLCACVCHRLLRFNSLRLGLAGGLGSSHLVIVVVVAAATPVVVAGALSFKTFSS